MSSRKSPDHTASSCAAAGRCVPSPCTYPAARLIQVTFAVVGWLGDIPQWCFWSREDDQQNPGMKGRPGVPEGGVQRARETAGAWFWSPGFAQVQERFHLSGLGRGRSPTSQGFVRRTPHSILLACWTSMTSVAIRTTSYWTRPCKCDSFLYIKKKKHLSTITCYSLGIRRWGNTFQVLKIPSTWGNWFSFRSLRRILQADEIDNRPYVILFLIYEQILFTIVSWGKCIDVQTAKYIEICCRHAGAVMIWSWWMCMSSGRNRGGVEMR